MVPRMKERYEKEVVPALMERFGYKSVMQVPKVVRISVNVGLGEALQNAKAIEYATNDLMTITGQKPVVRRARKAIATFKLRENNPIGLSVSLRGRRMWDFLDRLINVALPRKRDFQGVSADAFDGHGNYSLGLQEQLVFPEIDYDSIDKLRGMGISIVTTAKTDEEGRELFRLLGMPFKRK
ncbi:MAG: 50S ribosomal protein L5 [Clostridia bacterium]|nr:MAG: 50S ribosomal protein L5 [Clostridia bacterium]